MPTETPAAIVKPKLARRRVVEVAIGCLAGLVLACLNGPWLVSLLYKPPSGDAFSCAGTVSDALNYFVRLQLIAGAVGGLLLLGGSFLFRRMLRKRKEARSGAVA